MLKVNTFQAFFSDRAIVPRNELLLTGVLGTAKYAVEIKRRAISHVPQVNPNWMWPAPIEQAIRCIQAFICFSSTYWNFCDHPVENLFFWDDDRAALMLALLSDYSLVFSDLLVHLGIVRLNLPFCVIARSQHCPDCYSCQNELGLKPRYGEHRTEGIDAKMDKM